MPICCDCEKQVPKSGFAKSQLKKAATDRRCLKCAAAKDAAQGQASKNGDRNGGAKTEDESKSKLEAKVVDEQEEEVNDADAVAREKAEKEAEKAKKEAEKAKKEAEKAKKEAERVKAAEEKAKKEAEAKARKEAEKARKEADAKARKEAEEAERAKKEAEAKARKEAEKAKKEAEAMARKEAEKAKKEAEAKAKKEAEEAEKAKKEAEAKAKKEAVEAEMAKKEAEAKARKEAEEAEKAKKEAEAKARKEAEAKAKKEAEAKAKKEAEAKAKKEAEAKAKKEAEAKAKKEAEAKAKKEAEAKARKEAEEAEKAKKETEAKAKKEAEAKAKKEAEAKAKKEAEAEAKAKEAEEAEKKKKEAEAKAKKDVVAAKKERGVAVEKVAGAPNKKANGSDAVRSADASSTALPPGLEASLPLLSASQRDLATKLCSSAVNQRHLFERWSADDSDADAKRGMMTQLENVDRTYPSGGILGYISNARDLLEKSKRGVNPLEGWKPSVPTGQNFEIGSAEYTETEKTGLSEVGRCGFVLVAGGLGERLGYNGIKIGLPTELATLTCYAQYYIETILAYQAKYAKPGIKMPLCIMTSGDTNAKTVELLEQKGYFGMDKEQITIVQQGDGVPALTDNDARIAVDPSDPYRILSKPHGHGDIHALIHSEGVAKKWLASGIRWAVFFQDTNGLAFHTLPLFLGVSIKLGLVMNSMAVPRKAKQAIGGIAKLTNKEGEHKTINVEYNQLDPLLRATGCPDGDVNDKKTGYSPFPGNINQLLFDLKPYAAALERTNGAMPEFVNPKYKDAEKTIFKKPTRLECMMQDFPTVLQGADAEKVGFTSTAAELCFSPVKNATPDGAALQKKGTHPGVAASGEADQYRSIRRIMTSIGCVVAEAKPATYNGISVVPGPEVVLKPSFVSCPAEYKVKFSSPEKVRISARSSLVISGEGVTVESLDLDGALVIECEEGASGIIRDLVVKNAGWKKVPAQSSKSEVIAMRGYELKKIETKTIIFKRDGSIEGGYETPPVSTDSAYDKTNDRLPRSLTEPAKQEAKEKTNDCNCVIL